jgi:hypothetical protein
MKFSGWFASRHIAKSVVKVAAARSPADIALIGAGVTSATASVVFAVAMIGQGDHAPMINGLQYLGVFGQPHRAAIASAATTPAAAGTLPTGAKAPPPSSTQVVAAASAIPPRAAGQSVDLTPTGSIARGPGDAPPDGDPYHVVAIEPGIAWLRNSLETRVVKPGDFAPGLGRIGAIVIRDGRWTLVDESGATLLAAETTAADPFSRRMIFGGN